MNNLNVLYEDNHIIVVEKPVNVLSQGDNTGDISLLDMVKEYVKEKYNKPGNVYLGLVHRLDRMTSGIMVFAKTSKAASRLNEQIKNNEFEKRYYCIVEGLLNKKGTLENYLYKDEKLVKSFVTNDKTKGKLAKLEYEAQIVGENESLVDVLLITGRHHQIRVQFSYIGHPLKGDTLYGSNFKKDFMLHAYSLSFNHPVTKERLTFVEKPNWYKEAL